MVCLPKLGKHKIKSNVHSRMWYCTYIHHVYIWLIRIIMTDNMQRPEYITCVLDEDADEASKWRSELWKVSGFDKRRGVPKVSRTSDTDWERTDTEFLEFMPGKVNAAGKTGGVVSVQIKGMVDVTKIPTNTTGGEWYTGRPFYHNYNPTSVKSRGDQVYKIML